MNFNTAVLPTKTQVLVDKFNQQSDLNFLEPFYLSGGTALALQLNHRQSEDLDFFSQRDFKPERLLSQLRSFGQISQSEIAPNTLNLYLDGVKLQFLAYPYHLLEKLVSWQKLRLSSVLDIALTKLITISQRGSKKDFIDLYFILDRFDLGKLMVLLNQKYPQVNYNQIHILKSLTYFQIAENQPMPRLINKDLEWSELKQKIIEAVAKVKI